jgi:lipoate-protein ligase A
MIEVKSYNLPDIELLETEGLNVFLWVPDKTYLVLGQRDDLESSVYLEKAQKDNITILKRPSGGHSVLLSRNTIVIAISITNLNLGETKKFFNACNSAVIKGLEKQNITGVSQKGISDLSYGKLKIMGSSMYRPRNHTFFHAVLNVNEKPENIAKYLKHPKSEPDYRKGRSHNDFITSLSELGYSVNDKKLEKDIKLAIRGSLKKF